MAPWISLALLVLAGLGLVLRHDMISVIGFDLGIASTIIGIVGLIMFSGRSDAGDSDPLTPMASGEPSSRARGPLIVTSFAGMLFAGYCLLGPAKQLIIGAPDPSQNIAETAQAPIPGRAALRLRQDADGTFNARSRVNNTSLTLRVDTGATSIVLSADDARRAGIALGRLNYSVPVKTAHGTSYAAPTQLSRVFVGPLGAEDVPALVAKPGTLDTSLLGMSFLKRLRSYSIEGNYLTLEG